MRVLLLVEGVPTSAGAVAEVSEALRAAGADMVVASVRESPRLAEALEPRKLPHLSLDARTSRGYPRGAVRLARRLRELEIDVIHELEPIAATVGTVASKLAGRSKRLFDRQHSDAGWRQARLSRFASRHAHLVRVPSEAAKRWALAQDRIPPERVRVVYNAAARPTDVTQSQVAALRRRLGISEDADIVCTVARLRQGKGIETGIAAVRLLAMGRERPLHYVIAGDGEMRGELATLSSGLPNIHLAGHQDEVHPWYALGDVIWMPSRNESFGIAAAEAMASARPLVASAVGGLTELVVDGKTGVLVTPGDAQELASVTARLLADREQRIAMGRAARQRYEEHFTLEGQAKGLVACYRELTAQ